MSTSPVTPAPTAPEAAPAPKLTAIQLAEKELQSFFQQREQLVANIHAVDGAIQAGQRILTVLREAEAKAAEEAKKLVAATEAEAKKVESNVVSIADHAEAAVEKVL